METKQGWADSDPVVDPLVQLSFAVLDILGRAAAQHDLSVTQLRLLGILRDREPTMAEIAAFLRLDRSSVSGLIDRAEKRDIVARHTSPRDARVTTVRLTDAGRRLADEVGPTLYAQIEKLLGQLTPAERKTIVGLGRLTSPDY
jgi:MarR family transcriptional regulator, lower aerobic nicotinate degradation pathway regulator